MAGHLSFPAVKEQKAVHQLVEEKEVFFFDVGNTLLHLDLDLIQKLLRDCKIFVEQSTLIEAEGKAREAVDQAFFQGQKINDATLGSIYFRSIFQHLGVPQDHFPFLKRELLCANERLDLWSIIKPETEKVLQRLRQHKKKLGVISNSDGKVKQRLRKYGLEKHFEMILDSHEVGVEKPNRAIFELALKAFKTKPRQALYIGDLYAVDIEGARAANMDALLLNPSGSYRHPPCKEIRSLAEILPE